MRSPRCARAGCSIPSAGNSLAGAWYNFRMNYELAKKLKEAGWPQRNATFYLVKWLDFGDAGKFYPQGDVLVHKTDPLVKGGYQGGEISAAPTLEELIEACGAGLSSLNRVPGGWITMSPIGLVPLMANTQGATPAEAVAKLWLALNKK